MSKKEKTFEEATMEENPTEKMDRIVEATNQFEVVNTLIGILAKECGLPKESSLQDILKEAVDIYKTYYEAMEEFKNLRNQNQGRNRKEMERK